MDKEEEETPPYWFVKRQRVDDQKSTVTGKIPVTMIVCYDGATDAIGTFNGELPWNNPPEEMSRFIMNKVRETSSPSKKNGIVLGRNMFTEIAEEKCIPGCVTGILSTRMSLLGKDTSMLITAVAFRSNPADHIVGLYEEFEKLGNIEHIYVLGGAQTFIDMMDHCDYFIGLMYTPPMSNNPTDLLEDDTKSIRKPYDYTISFDHRFVEKDTSRRVSLAPFLEARFFNKK